MILINCVNKSQSANDNQVSGIYDIQEVIPNEISFTHEKLSTHACSSIYLKKDAHDVYTVQWKPNHNDEGKDNTFAAFDYLLGRMFFIFMLFQR